MLRCHATNAALRETNKAPAVICWIMEDLLFAVKSMERLDTFIPSHIILIVSNLTIVQQCNIVINNSYLAQEENICIFVICRAEDDLPAGVRGGCVHVFLVSAQFPECFDGPGHSGSFVQVHQHNTTLTTIYAK